VNWSKLVEDRPLLNTLFLRRWRFYKTSYTMKIPI